MNNLINLCGGPEEHTTKCTQSFSPSLDSHANVNKELVLIYQR